MSGHEDTPPVFQGSVRARVKSRTLTQVFPEQFDKISKVFDALVQCMIERTPFYRQDAKGAERLRQEKQDPPWMPKSRRHLGILGMSAQAGVSGVWACASWRPWRLGVDPFFLTAILFDRNE
jgi:hypothetical protein